MSGKLLDRLSTVALKSMAGYSWTALYYVSRCVFTLVVSVNLMLVALTSSFHADDSNSNSDGVIIILTSNTFDVTLYETEHLFVNFCE